MAANRGLVLDVNVPRTEESRGSKTVTVVTPTPSDVYSIWSVHDPEDPADDRPDPVRRRVRADSDLTTYKKSNVAALLCLQLSEEMTRLCCGACVVTGLGLSICSMIYLVTVYF